MSSDNPIIIVSETGHRGAIAMMALQLIGYQDVTNLAGGTDALGAQLAQIDLNASLATVLAAVAEEPLLTVSDLQAELSAGGSPVTLVDVRAADAYGDGFIEGAVNIPLNSLVDRLEALGDPAGRLVAVDRSGFHAGIAATALRLLGYKGATGLSGGLEAWEAAGLPVVTDPIPEPAAGTPPTIDPTVREAVANLLAGVQAEAWSAVEPATLAGIAPSERPPVVDLRPAAAYNDGHIEGAVNIPLAILVGQIDRIPTGGPVILVDETGYGSAVAFAALRLLGYSDVRHVAGGMAGWRAEGLPEAAVLRHLTWRRCAPARAIPIG